MNATSGVPVSGNCRRWATVVKKRAVSSEVISHATMVVAASLL